jgi:hypothetical protein
MSYNYVWASMFSILSDMFLVDYIVQAAFVWISYLGMFHSKNFMGLKQGLLGGLNIYYKTNYTDGDGKSRDEFINPN